MSCIVRNIHAKISGQPQFELKAVSFALGEGHILAILGQSGAGKTSLLNALAGFLPVQHGAIILDDNTVSCASYCLPPIERNMGIIFQDHNLLPHLTLIDNLTLGMKKQEIAERREEIQAMLQDLHLDHLQQTLPHQVSGGQQQRIALGRAILHNKKLLLFDEPFSGLDHHRMIQLAQTIKESVKKYKRIAILVTHHLEEAFLIADTIGIMKEGQLLEVSSPELMYHEPESLGIAQYVGPVNILKGKRKSNTQAKTPFGIVHTSNHILSSIDEVQILSRPDDYAVIKGKDYVVCDILFSGMSKLVTVSNDTSTITVSLEHHTSIKRGDYIGLKLKDDHPYLAYDMNGKKISHA